MYSCFTDFERHCVVTYAHDGDGIELPRSRAEMEGWEDEMFRARDRAILDALEAERERRIDDWANYGAVAGTGVGAAKAIRGLSVLGDDSSLHPAALFLALPAGAGLGYLMGHLTGRWLYPRDAKKRLQQEVLDGVKNQSGGSRSYASEGIYSGLTRREREELERLKERDKFFSGDRAVDRRDLIDALAEANRRDWREMRSHRPTARGLMMGALGAALGGYAGSELAEHLAPDSEWHKIGGMMLGAGLGGMTGGAVGGHWGTLDDVSQAEKVINAADRAELAQRAYDELRRSYQRKVIEDRLGRKSWEKMRDYID